MSATPQIRVAREEAPLPLRYTVQAVTESPGDFGAFEDLAMPLFARLYNFACWLSRDTSSAEDLVQETYMKALRGFSSFQQGTNFRAWIYRILRNTFLTSRAGLEASAMVNIDDEAVAEPSTGVTPESVFLARAEAAAIQRALEELPIHFREIILLCDWEEMSYQEIGQTLSIPIGTVMSRVSRARKAMRAALAAKMEIVRR
ncbi:MAG TPA: sigma-70 family RNA polymerase sigma factor [Terracidiphilus sp.]|nr:sigma-70 family RNA polymerase sigma factor [Terracidiphilus sp.]